VVSHNLVVTLKKEGVIAYEAIIYEKVEDKIFRITLNRPEKLNARSRQLLSELDSALDE
jgi:enoyl-CoA hydratase/carnithine racemase